MQAVLSGHRHHQQQLPLQHRLISSRNSSTAPYGDDGFSDIKPLIANLWKLCSPDKGVLISAAVLLVLAAACELAIPCALVAGYSISACLRGFCFSLLNIRMTRRLRTQLFAAIIRRPVSFFDQTEVGQLTSRLQADCQAMSKSIATNLNIILRNGLQCLGGIGYLHVLSPHLCGITLGISCILWGVTLFYGDFARKLQKVSQDVLACSNTVAEEVMGLNRIVRTFGTENVEEKRYESWLDRLYHVGLRQSTGYGLFVASGHITIYATRVAALIAGCSMVVQGVLTAEQLTQFIFYVEFVTYASLNVCDEYTELMEAFGASERVVKLLDEQPAVQIAAGATPASFSGHVELKDVSFSYPTRPDAVALNNVSISLTPGQLTALVGLSGSGKTTVVALLQRLYDPGQGAVLVDGVDLRTLDAGWYRSHVGVVSQEPRLFASTVAANISYGCQGLNDVSRADVEHAAKLSNAYDFIMKLPQGFDTPVTDKLLSGGQKQRIALARALVRPQMKLLVLDEATSALDAESESQVQGALDAAMRDETLSRAVVVIAHRLSTVRKADVIIVMDKGQVIEKGSHDQLLQQRGAYFRLVQRQLHGSLEPVGEDDVPVKNGSTPVALMTLTEDGMQQDDSPAVTSSSASSVSMEEMQLAGGQQVDRLRD
ncbi:MAG: hypothetical protein WDW38_005681 [Sanguina aurantia]